MALDVLKDCDAVTDDLSVDGKINDMAEPFPLTFTHRNRLHEVYLLRGNHGGISNERLWGHFYCRMTRVHF